MTDNTCSICLEPLFSKDGNDIGVTGPCGHCFHTECFGSWQAAANRRHCKCPNCNVVSKSFVKIFISLPDNIDDEDDDISLHSSDSTSTSEDNETNLDTDDDNNQNNNTINDSPENTLGEEMNDDYQMFEEFSAVASRPQPTSPPDGAIDLTDSPLSTPQRVNSPQQLRRRRQRAPRQVSLESHVPGDDDKKKPATSSYHSSSPENEQTEIKRLSKIAKRYKRRYKKQQSSFRSLTEDQNKLREQLGLVKSDLMEQVGARDELLETIHRQELKIDGLELQVVRLANENKKQAEQISSNQQILANSDKKLKALQTNYNKDLEKARADSMAEVKQLLEERPKLLSENRQLKELIKRYQRNEPVRASNSIKSVDPNGQKLSGLKMARDLRQMDQVRQTKQIGFNNTAEPNPGEQVRTTPVDMKKYSNQSLRMASKATQKNNRTALLGMLNRIDNESSGTFQSNGFASANTSTGFRALESADSSNTRLGNKKVAAPKRKEPPSNDSGELHGISRHQSGVIRAPSINIGAKKKRSFFEL